MRIQLTSWSGEVRWVSRWDNYLKMHGPMRTRKPFRAFHSCECETPDIASLCQTSGLGARFTGSRSCFLMAYQVILLQTVTRDQGGFVLRVLVERRNSLMIMLFLSGMARVQAQSRFIESGHIWA